MRTRVCITGITNLNDAQTALDYGAHALGITLGTPPAGLTPEQVRQLVRALTPCTVLMGECAHQPAMELRELLRQCQLDAAQLPAQATVDDCRLLRQRFRVVKHLSLPQGTPAEAWHKAITGLLPVADAVILDMAVLVDGDGRLTPVGSLARDLGEQGPHVMVTVDGSLAGMEALMRQFRPYAVQAGAALDLAGSPGRKDWRLIRQFIRSLRREERRPVA